MRLSEAIRIGASWSGQAKEAFKDGNGNTCALGAAVEGCFGDKFKDYLLTHNLTLPDQMHDKFPYLMYNVVNEKLPADFKGSTLAHMIMFLNDAQGLTREQIADRVEQIENEHPEWFENEVKIEEAEIIKKENA